MAGGCIALPAGGEAQRPTSRCLSDTTHTAASTVSLQTVDTVASGVTYTCQRRPEGPWLVHVVTIDLRTPGLALDAVRATDSRIGRERVSAMAERLVSRGERPVVAINADFFDLASGEIENNHVVRREWVKGALVTDSPHDEFDNRHTQFATDTLGRPFIGRFALRGEVIAGPLTQPMAGINYRPPTPAGLVLFTPWYGPHTLRDTRRDRAAAGATPSVPAGTPSSIAQQRADSARALALDATRQAVEVSLVASGRRGDTLLYRVSRRRVQVGGGTPIGARGAVLSATGDSAIAFVRALARRGGTVRVVAALEGPPAFAPQMSVGGWPRVVQDGRNVGHQADSLEGTFPRFSSGRHPRSAIALSRDSTQLLLVVVDGRRPWSVGMSLAELGDALLQMGAYQAMNLDGGGSSALWVQGEVVNYPSDPSGERAVGNALLVRRLTP